MIDEAFKQSFFAEADKQFQVLSTGEFIPFKTMMSDEIITLVLRFDDDVTSFIAELIDQLSTVQDQIYYHPSSLHMTVLGRLSSDIDLEKLISVVDIIQFSDMEFDFLGVNAFINGASVTGFPVGFDFHELRENIRGELGVQGDDYGIFLPHYQHLGWINFLRYSQKPSVELLRVLDEFKQVSLRNIKPIRLEIVKTATPLLMDAKVLWSK